MTLACTRLALPTGSARKQGGCVPWIRQKVAAMLRLGESAPYKPRDHFCSRTQRNAATTHPMPASGMLETKVHTAALIKHSTMAKTPTSMLVIDRDSAIHNGRDMSEIGVILARHRVGRGTRTQFNARDRGVGPAGFEPATKGL